MSLLDTSVSSICIFSPKTKLIKEDVFILIEGIITLPKYIFHCVERLLREIIEYKVSIGCWLLLSTNIAINTKRNWNLYHSVLY